MLSNAVIGHTISSALGQTIPLPRLVLVPCAQPHFRSEQIWMLITNENKTADYSFKCTDSLLISLPYEANTVVRNLLPPFENYTLEKSGESYNNDSKAPWRDCLPNATMDLFGFKLLVPTSVWIPPKLTLAKFTPSHDARITGGGSGQDNIRRFSRVQHSYVLFGCYTGTVGQCIKWRKLHLAFD